MMPEFTTYRQPRAVEAILKTHIGDPRQTAFISDRDLLHDSLRDIFDVEEADTQMHRLLPDLITSIATNIARCNTDISEHLPELWKESLRHQGRRPFAILAGRVARDILESVDPTRYQAADLYRNAYPYEDLARLRPETQEIIRAIQNYIPNNDILIFVPTNKQQNMIHSLEKHITHGTHSIIILQDGLTLLQTTVDTEHGPWTNYTILMDPDHDLSHDWRHCPKLPNNQNDTAIVTVDKNGEIEILHTYAWFMNKRNQHKSISIESPSSYDSLFHWLNAVTRMGLPIVRRQLSVYANPRTFWLNAAESIDIKTRELLSSDLQRLITQGQPQNPTDAFHRNEVFQQLAVLLETDPNIAVIILTVTGFLPQLAHQNPCNTKEEQQEFVRMFMERALKHEKTHPTFVHAFVKTISDLRNIHCVDGMEGLIDLVDGLTS